MNFNHIHYSWKPVLSEFNTDAFLYFKNEVLPREKYYPEADKVFRVFSMPVSEIKVVVIGPWNLRTLTKPKELQGIFWLPISLTQGAETEHNQYWEPFIKKVVYFIAKSNPTLWLLPTIEAQRFAANLPVKSIFNVLRYDDSTIHQIPVNVDYNYVFKGIYVNTKHINILLEKLGKETINW
jgi:uracil-DNA glycosylase